MSYTAKSISGLVQAVASRAPSSVALRSPFQSQTFTYEELSATSNALAGFLSMYGYRARDVLISDLPNVAENLILQLACNRLGVAFATANNLEGMAKFPRIAGAVAAHDTGFLAETGLPVPHLSGEFLTDLIHNGGLDEYRQESFAESEPDVTHACYNSPAAPYTNRQALAQGEDAAFELSMCADDTVCISVTLCHAFGIGSGICSVFSRGATAVLPAVGGIRGCGAPSERAAATLEVLRDEKCTLLFADTHTLRALPAPPHDLPLRGGACKIGSGSTFLEETRTYSRVDLRAVGKKE